VVGVGPTGESQAEPFVPAFDTGWRVVEEGCEVLAAPGHVVTLDVGFDVVDRPSEAVGRRLADDLPSGFGDVEDRRKGVGLSQRFAAVPAAGIGGGGSALGVNERCADFDEGPGVGACGGVLPPAPAGVEVSEVVVQGAETPIGRDASLVRCLLWVVGC
jgi:hypothetical protein